MPQTPAISSPSSLDPVVRILRAVVEGLVLLLVCLTPWAFGCVHPSFEFLLDAGIALLLILWGLSILLHGQRLWDSCPVAWCLAGLLLLGLWQLAPLSRPSLGWVSPGTTRWYERLLPQEPEQLPDGTLVDGPDRMGRAISFDPGATRTEVVRLLALFALFMVVRQQLASPAAFRRLCMAATVNGTLIALFALLQFWTAPRGTLYWSFPSVGWAFGPFINHDHAASYLNLCLGLALGPFLARSRRAEVRSGRNWWLDADVLALMLSLTILLVGVAFSLSRGGLLSFFGAAVLCLAIRAALGMRGPMLGSLLAIVGLACVLLAWFGIGPMMDRLNVAAEHGEPGRFRCWSRVLPLTQDFPLWGTGYGTFGSVELTQRTDVLDAGFAFSHAHNEYVEALVEGGFPRLLLTLGVIVLLGRAAVRVMRREPGSLGADLAFGGLFAVTTLTLQSFVEFSVHIPAIAVLATVICAQLSGVEAANPQFSTGSRIRENAGEASANPHSHECGYSRTNFAPPGGSLPTRVLAALVVLGVAFVLGAEGWKAYRVDSLQSSALMTGGTLDSEQILQLEKASRLAPDNASLHLELAQAHRHAADEQKKQLVRQLLVREAVQTVVLFAPVGDIAHSPHPMLTRLPGFLALTQARERLLEADRQFFHPHVSQELRHLIQARNANPLLAAPHLLLAAHARELARADSPLIYLDRAKRLAPTDAHLWYLCGLRELNLLQLQRTRAAWRRSLELSNEHLQDVLKLSTPIFSPRLIRTEILAEKVDQLFLAAFQLFPADDQQAERRPFLEQALALFEQQPAPRLAEDLHVEAVILASLNYPDRALTAYQNALGQQPNRLEWRWEFAKLLHQQARLPEARLELLTILKEQPGHAPARELWRIVERESADKR